MSKSVGMERMVGQRGYLPSVLPIPRRAELWPRLARLMVGLVLFGFGLALMVIAELGLSPWDVFHQGISERTGIPIGTVVIITGLLLLVTWIPLREKIGIGTIANAIVIGVVLDLALLVLPESIDLLAARWLAMLTGILIVAIGSGLYIGAGLGPGPRDGLMTGLGRITGYPIGLVRAVLEIGVLIVGWLLGGTVGAGTLVFAFGIGPMVQFFLSRLELAPVVKESGAG
jgi:uncharacterized membrane protein YczE